MKWSLCPILLAGILSANFSLPAAEPVITQGQTIPPQPEPIPHWIGMSSCALRGCHNGKSNGAGSEFRLWSTQDRHSRAFDVLLESRSQLMAQAIGLKQPAHEAQICLKCHSAGLASPEPNHKLRLSEGVSCEVCHGPASQWLDPHLRHDWRTQPKLLKSDFGLRDLSSPRGRVETCINCHVGSPGSEVTHDMIAAGHPRLLFEATAFLDAIPKHWDEAKVRRDDLQYSAKLWLIGQTATLRRTVANMEARTPDRVEFADHDCYACHKSLSARSTEKSASPRTWGQWPSELMQLTEKRSIGLPAGTSEDVKQLRDRLRVTTFDRATLNAHALSQKLAAWDQFADRVAWSPSELRALMVQCATPIAPGVGEWDVAWQRYRALLALAQAWNPGNEVVAKKLATPLSGLKASLRMPTGFSSPTTFDPAAFNQQLKVVRETLSDGSAQ
jgi:hypothetical protein